MIVGTNGHRSKKKEVLLYEAVSAVQERSKTTAPDSCATPKGV